MQINYRWHGRAFPSLDAMFDPEYTATYAAQFLRTLYEERGSWSAAAGAYHSLSPELGGDLSHSASTGCSADLEPGALTDAEALVAAAVPERPLQHAGRRGARRSGGRWPSGSAPPGRRRSRGRAASPGRCSCRRRASLLVQGTPLLSQGQPLITAPRGGLF